MTDWLDLLTDAKPLKPVYGETHPTLRNVEITKFQLGAIGRDLVLRLNLAEFPLIPPKKWAAENTDTVEIELRLMNLTSLHVAGISSKKFTDISLTRQVDAILTHIEDEFATLRAVSDFVGAYSMRAFRRADRTDSS